MKELVCLHGFTGSSAAWDRVIERLDPAIVVHRPALYGHDPAGSPEPLRDFGGEVDRLAGWIGEHCQSPVHLAGYSMGGRLGFGLLARHRPLFASATLVGARLGLEDAAERRRRIADDQALADRIERQGVESFVDHWQGLALFASQQRLPPEVLASQRRQRLRHRPEGLAGALRALGLGRMPDYRPELATCTVPVHGLAGGQDEKFCRLAHALAESLRCVTAEIVPGAGHNLTLEAPRAVSAAIARGIDR